MVADEKQEMLKVSVYFMMLNGEAAASSDLNVTFNSR